MDMNAAEQRYPWETTLGGLYIQGTLTAGKPKQVNEPYGSVCTTTSTYTKKKQTAPFRGGGCKPHFCQPELNQQLCRCRTTQRDSKLQQREDYVVVFFLIDNQTVFQVVLLPHHYSFATIPGKLYYALKAKADHQQRVPR